MPYYFKFYVLAILGGIVAKESPSFRASWGFQPHRIINRMAVFTLPSACMPLFKDNIEFLALHATSADKRRYATDFEASRHYIDLDKLEEHDTLRAPVKLIDALKAFRAILRVRGEDTSNYLVTNPFIEARIDSIHWISRHDRFINIEFDRTVDARGPVTSSEAVLVIDNMLAEHGILPYHMLVAQNRLTHLMQYGSIEDMLKQAADLGHYIADAHVPLHTTSNYNGQLTGQTGIHALWETRIPELESEGYDFLTGRAEYIEQKDDYFWAIVRESNSLVDSVLEMEAAVRDIMSDDQEYCHVLRNGIMTRQECPEFVQAYSVALSGMVERRMQAAVLAIGSAWYTAWVDAGKPIYKGQVKVDIVKRSLEAEVFRDEVMGHRVRN